jgi:hypothetical protein
MHIFLCLLLGMTLGVVFDVSGRYILNRISAKQARLNTDGIITVSEYEAVRKNGYLQGNKVMSGQDGDWS